MTNAKTFLETLKKVANTASNDATRYHMSGVFVQRLDNGNVQFQASDGHCYASVTEHLPAINEVMKTTGHYWFHYDQIKLIPLKAKSVCTVQADKEELTLTSDGLTITSEAMPNRPGFESIEPKRLIEGDATHVDVMFNPDLLLAVRKALATHVKDTNGLKIRIPVTIKDDGTIKQDMGAMVAIKDSALGLIMPMRH